MKQWRRFFWKLKWRLRLPSEIRGATIELRERSDERENEISTPPAGEEVTWWGYWCAEIYAPSHVERLIAGLDALGLTADRAGGRHLGEWIRETRPQGGAWSNIGFFARPGRFLGSSIGPQIDVAPEFAFMQLGLHQVAPGLSVLVSQFVLEETERKSLDAVFRQSFQGEARRAKRGGYTLHHARDLKEEEISRIRDDLRSIGSKWIEDHIPGLFSRMPGSSPITWDLLTSNEELLFPLELESADWRSLLGFGAMPTCWKSSDLGEFFLVMPSGLARSSSVPTFTGIAQNITGGQADREDHEYALPQRLHQSLDGVVAALAVDAALTAYRKRFAHIRDELAAPLDRKFSGAGHRLKTLQQEVLPMAFDLETFGRAAREDQADFFLMEDGPDFKRLPRIRHGEPIERVGDLELFDALKKQVLLCTGAVVEQAQSIAEGLRTQAEVLLAVTNIRLQRTVAALTVLATAAALYASIAAG